MRIYIVRHGAPNYELDCLTPLGKAQANVIPNFFQTHNVHRILSSPLGRAKETAKPLSEYLNIPMEVEPWLRELDDLTVYSSKRPDLAVWNIPPDQLRELEKKDWLSEECFRDELYRERWNEVCMGVESLLREYSIVKTSDGWSMETDREFGMTAEEDIVLFGHLGVGMTLMAYLLGVSPCTVWRSVFLAPASVTCLLVECMEERKVNFRILQTGDVSHLEKNGIAVSTSGLQYNVN